MKQLAQITNPALGNLNSPSNQGAGFFAKLVPSLVGLAFVGGSVIFFFMLLLAAIQWITSGGDKASVEAARGRLTQALIGIILLFSSFVVVKLVETFFGISILTIDIGPFIVK